MLRKLGQALLETVMPEVCLGCGQIGSLVCSGCEATLQPVSCQVCIFCRKPSPFGLTHEQCGIKQSPKTLLSVFYYSRVSKIIITGKYHYLPSVFKYFSSPLSQALLQFRPDLLNNAMITYIPLFWSRKNWRGFNQSEILAREIAKKSEIQCVDTLKKIKPSLSQKDLEKQARKQNLKGVFQVINPEKIAGKRIILTDDVITSGETLLQASQVLLAAGAKEIHCLTIAR